MDTAIIHQVFCAPPDKRIAIPSHVSSQALVSAEETGSLWLWAWPELLGWPEEVTWLFSPVTGKRPWPGDLWGLDAAGNLLIVETKLAKAQRGMDPFEDFVGFEKPSPSWKGNSVFDSSTLFDRWNPLLQQEKRFIREQTTHLRQGIWDRKHFSGIVPYSYKRVEVWRWREIYLSKIAPKVENGRYEEAVSRGMTKRKEKGNPKPHYIGFFTVCPNGEPRLSARGKVNHAELCKISTPERVHLLAAEAIQTKPTEVKIHSWHIP